MKHCRQYAAHTPQALLCHKIRQLPDTPRTQQKLSLTGNQPTARHTTHSKAVHCHAAQLYDSAHTAEAVGCPAQTLADGVSCARLSAKSSETANPKHSMQEQRTQKGAVHCLAESGAEVEQVSCARLGTRSSAAATPPVLPLADA